MKEKPVVYCILADLLIGLVLVACAGQATITSIPSPTNESPALLLTTTAAPGKSRVPMVTPSAPVPTSATIGPTPAPTLTPTASPSPGILPTPSPSATPPLKAWQGVPLGPAGVELAAQEETFVVLRSTAPLDAVEAFYRDRMRADRVLFEHLRTPQTRFGGEAVFLLFWRPDQTVCLLAAQDLTTGSDKTVVTVSKDCAALRMTAENLRTRPWAAPAGIAWRVWESSIFRLRYPSSWMEDKQLFRQPYCQLDTEIRCLAGFVYRDAKGQGLLSVIAQPYPEGKTLSEAAVAAWQEGARAVPGLTWVVGEPIRLDDGTPAIQILSTYWATEAPGILIAVYVASGETLYALTGTVAGEQEGIWPLNEMLGAMIRSFRLLEK